MSTTTPYLVPLQAEPQTFSISLAGNTYTLTLKWNAPNATWVLDIADANGNDIVTGIPLVTGVDLLGQYKYLGIGGSLVVQSTNDPSLVPNDETLGSTGNLFFLVTSD